MSLNDDDVVRWYASQSLSRDAVERVLADPGRATSDPRRAGARMRFVAAAAVGFGLGALGVSWWWMGREAAVAQAPGFLVASTLKLEDLLPHVDPTDVLVVPEGYQILHLPLDQVVGDRGRLRPGAWVDVIPQTSARPEVRPGVLVVHVRPGVDGRVSVLTAADDALAGPVVMTPAVEGTARTVPEAVGDALHAQLRALQRRAALDVDVALGSLTGPVAVADVPSARLSLQRDTSAYDVAEAVVFWGARPDPDDVDVQAFVDAVPFDIDPATRALAVLAEVAPSPWTPGHHVVRLRVATPPAHQRTDPVHLTLLVPGDVDATALRRAVGPALQRLRSHDTVSILSAGEEVRTVLPPTAPQDPAVAEAWSQLAPRSRAGLGGGLMAAYAHARRHADAEGQHRVVLCTSGLQHLAPAEGEALATLVRSPETSTIGLTVLSIGPSGPDPVAGRVAHALGGRFVVADDPAQLDRAFVAYAREAELAVQWDPATVATWRALRGGSRPGAADDSLAVPAELGADHRSTALFEVRLHPGGAGLGVASLGDLTLQARSPSGPGPLQASVPLTATVYPQLQMAPPGMRLALSAASVGLALAEVPGMALPWAQIAALAGGRVRPAHREADIALWGVVAGAAGLEPASASITPVPAPADADLHPCRPMVVIQGGDVVTVEVNEKGEPCAAPAAPRSCQPMKWVLGSQEQTLYVDARGVPCELAQRPGSRCRPFHLVSGAGKTTTLVDEQGAPCD